MGFNLDKVKALAVSLRVLTSEEKTSLAANLLHQAMQEKRVLILDSVTPGPGCPVRVLAAHGRCAADLKLLIESWKEERLARGNRLGERGSTIDPDGTLRPWDPMTDE